MNISGKIRQIMEQKNINGQELAKKIGSSRSYISTILSGRVGISDDKTIEILMHGFNITAQSARQSLALWKVEDILDSNPDIIEKLCELTSQYKKNKKKQEYEYQDENILDRLLHLDHNDREELIKLLRITDEDANKE